jgi:nucleoside-diphosphate-sugar epimerase
MLQGHPNISFHQLDITDRKAIRNLFVATNHQPPFTGVINLAARAGVRQSVEDPWVYYETNVTGTLNLLELCREFASKKAAEALCYTYHYLHGLDVTVLRYFTVYGPAGRPDMSIFRFIKWIAEGDPVIVYGDGRQERDFTYVEDIARGTILGLKPLGYEVINLGSDHPVPLKTVLAHVEDILGKSARIERQPIHPADVPATWADVSRARRLLDWTPQTTLEEGLQAAMAWYQANRQWAREIQLGS